MIKPFHNDQLYGDDLRRELLGSTKALPPMPQVLIKARRIAASPSASLADLAAVLETDPALAMRVLHLTNSGYYRRANHITGVQQACVLLGEQALMHLITIVSMERMVSRSLEGYHIDAQAMYRHSLAVGVGARLIAAAFNPEKEETAFTAGLVHDIGKTVLDPFIEARYPAYRLALRNSASCTAESVVLGFDHAEMGASFCDHWSMGEEITNAVRYHHSPNDEDASTVAAIVHIADFAAHAGDFNCNDDESYIELQDDVLEHIGLGPSDLGELQAQVKTEVEHMTQGVLNTERD